MQLYKLLSTDLSTYSNLAFNICESSSLDLAMRRLMSMSIWCPFRSFFSWHQWDWTSVGRTDGSQAVFKRSRHWRVKMFGPLVRYKTIIIMRWSIFSPAARFLFVVAWCYIAPKPSLINGLSNKNIFQIEPVVPEISTFNQAKKTLQLYNIIC